MIKEFRVMPSIATQVHLGPLEINAYLGDYILNHKTSSLKVADLKQYLQYIGFGKDIR